MAKLGPTVRRILRRTPLRPVVTSLRRRREEAAWKSGGGPAPHTAKVAAVREYAAHYGLSVLVETGTFTGEMVKAQRGHFKRIATIELDDALYEAVVAEFATDPSVSVFHGDSADILPMVVADLDEPALLWLDAHYSGGSTARGNIDTPISAEIDFLLGRAQPDVILIDDARLFDGTDGYPTLAELELAVRNRRPDLSFETHKDIIRITPERQATSQPSSTPLVN